MAPEAAKSHVAVLALLAGAAVLALIAMLIWTDVIPLGDARALGAGGLLGAATLEVLLAVRFLVGSVNA